jgi:hypothetical protein
MVCNVGKATGIRADAELSGEKARFRRWSDAADPEAADKCGEMAGANGRARLTAHHWLMLESGRLITLKCPTARCSIKTGYAMPTVRSSRMQCIMQKHFNNRVLLDTTQLQRPEFTLL